VSRRSFHSETWPGKILPLLSVVLSHLSNARDLMIAGIGKQPVLASQERISYYRHLSIRCWKERYFPCKEVFMEDRDKVIEMLAKVRDNFSLNTYKKVYQITDQEIEEKKKALAAKGEKKH
jgi:hypothetical protein